MHNSKTSSIAPFLGSTVAAWTGLRTTASSLALHTPKRKLHTHVENAGPKRATYVVRIVWGAGDATTRAGASPMRACAYYCDNSGLKIMKNKVTTELWTKPPTHTRTPTRTLAPCTNPSMPMLPHSPQCCHASYYERNTKPNIHTK